MIWVVEAGLTRPFLVESLCANITRLILVPAAYNRNRVLHRDMEEEEFAPTGQINQGVEIVESDAGVFNLKTLANSYRHTKIAQTPTGMILARIVATMSVAVLGHGSHSTRGFRLLASPRTVVC